MNHTTVWQNEILMPRAENESAETVTCDTKHDKQLIELVLAGDETAFEQLFERYKRLVASIATQYFQHPEQIEEIIQISFTKIYFELKDFRGNYDFSLPSWLGKITNNVCLDTLRGQKRKAENQLSELSDSERETFRTQAAGNLENNFIERDLAEKLLSKLSAEDRAILQMLEVEEMSVKEIAEITGWSNSKVKVRAYRARHALRKVLRKFL